MLSWYSSLFEPNTKNATDKFWQNGVDEGEKEKTWTSMELKMIVSEIYQRKPKNSFNSALRLPSLDK